MVYVGKKVANGRKKREQRCQDKLAKWQSIRTQELHDIAKQGLEDLSLDMNFISAFLLGQSKKSLSS